MPHYDYELMMVLQLIKTANSIILFYYFCFLPIGAYARTYSLTPSHTYGCDPISIKRHCIILP